MKDKLNLKGHRNQKNTATHSYNCYGYALNTFSWMLPYDADEENLRDSEIEELFDNGFTLEEIEDIILEKDIEYIMDTFKDKIRLLSSPLDITASERLIAYRIFVLDEPDEDGDLYDFHFRFKEDYGIWKEKCGTYPPTLCADFNDWGDYDSKIIYFGFKI